MIEFKNVVKTYPNGFTALKRIDLQTEQGEFVAIIGLSGAGISWMPPARICPLPILPTLLRALTGRSPSGMWWQPMCSPTL